MPIKNYTTEVPANRSIQEIQDALVKHGAIGINLKYASDRSGRIEALQFILEMPRAGFPGDHIKVPFTLPVEWQKFQEVLKQQKVSRWKDEDYVYRVSWRCIRDWVMAQLALYETNIVELPQVFLPFVTNRKGSTMYDIFMENHGRLLLSEESRS